MSLPTSSRQENILYALKLLNDDNHLQVTVFDIPTHWTDLIGTSLVVGAVISMGFEDCVMDRVNWKWI